jgi:hypothetical protein
MARRVLAAVILAGMPALAHAQSAAAPLVVTATVVSTCSVDVPPSAEASAFAIMPVTLTCARGVTPRVLRPIAPRRTVGQTSSGPAVLDALLIINF